MDLFDQYLRDELSSLERENFEKRLNSDASFKKEFEQHRKAIRAIEFAAIKAKISKVSIEAQRSKTFSRKTFLAIAASIALLISAYVYTINRVDQPVNYEDVFASIHFKDPGLPSLMGQENTNQELNEMMLAYKQNKYREALNIGQELALKYPKSDTIQFYIAMVHYETEAYNEAEDILINIESNETVLAQKAEWYLHLIDLKKGDCRSAIAGIRNIAESKDHIFRIEAIDALDVLDLLECE